VAAGRIGSAFQKFRQVEAVRAGGVTDGQLLDQFVARREEAAFEALVRRHGPMVLGVCRRILNDGHDAEDAFQATFLVLVRKAASIVPRAVVGNWLYGVAYRTALKARTQAARRRAKEKQAKPVPHAEESDRPWDELLPLLDQEMSGLPDKYRVPIVLCDLEGKTRKEAARYLGWPEGTLSSRLALGRARLARRLSRASGKMLSGATLALALSQKTASACVPGSLLAVTVKAATLVAAGQSAAGGIISIPVAALTKGVLQAMLLSKVKIAAVVLLGLAVIGTGTGWIGGWMPAAEGQSVQKDRKIAGPEDESDPRDTKRGKRNNIEEEKENDRDELLTLEKKLKEVKLQAEALTRQHAILQIELAVKKLKQCKDPKEQAAALEKIMEAVQNFELKILKIDRATNKNQA
jgi:RNA polymerase sigma factor (sigma-70 family)